MSYLSVITLERAKNYLRVDLDFDTDDSEITSMINASCRYVEKRTNHILYARDITYKGSCQVKVYDYPINSIVTDPTPFKVDFAMLTCYPDVKEVELNVGYGVNEVPDDLIQAIMQMLHVFYYESEKQFNSTLIPESVKEMLDVNKRFL
jgi:hypothetical protein